MSYSKPMVTIELAEYNELLNLRKTFNQSIYKRAVQEILIAIQKNKGNNNLFFSRINDSLKEKGIAVLVSSDDQQEITNVQCREL